MDRRKFLVGLGSASVGGSALIGSGAFSRVEAQRSVTIEVAEDPDAYLGMDKCHIGGSDTPNSSYAHLDEYGHLKIYMDDNNPTIGNTDLGEGINSDSRTWFDNVFQLCNQGKEDVCVYIEDHEDWPYYDGDERRVEFYPGSFRDGSLIGEENQILLPLGECVCIGIRTTSKGLSEGDKLLENLDNKIRIIADVDGECIVEEPECADLSAEFLCLEGTEEPTSHVFTVTNVGDAATNFGWAILNSPDEANDATRPIGANANSEPVFDRDASAPLRGIVWWEDECDEDEVAALTRDNWTADDSLMTTEDIVDIPGTSSQSRYDEVKAIEDFEDLEAAFDDTQLPSGFTSMSELIPAGAFITEIDYSLLQAESDWSRNELLNNNECPEGVEFG